MLTRWPLIMTQNFSEETTPPAQTSPKIMSQFPHQKKQLQNKHTVRFPVKKNNPKKHFSLGFWILISIRAQHGGPGWEKTHSLGVEVWRLDAQVHYTMELKTLQKQSCKTWRFLFCRVKNLNKLLDANGSVLASRKKKPNWWRKQVTRVMAVYGFICSRVRVVVENAPCSWNINCRASRIMPTFAILAIFQRPIQHTRNKNLELGFKSKWKRSEVNFQEILHDGPSSHFGSRDFTQTLPSLIQYSVFSPEESFTGMTFLRVLGAVDRVDSYQPGGQTTQNWSQYDGLVVDIVFQVCLKTSGHPNPMVDYFYSPSGCP